MGAEPKKTKGKGKGSAFERQVAKQLSLWLSEGLEDSWVWRTSNSGGRATIRTRQGKGTSGGSGDLTYTDHRAAWFFDLFSIELKCGYANAEISALIDSNQAEPMLLKFWKQATTDADPHSVKSPILIVKRNNKVPLLFLSKYTYAKLVAVFGQFPLPRATLITEHCKLVVVHFQQFLNLVDPTILKGGL